MKSPKLYLFVLCVLMVSVVLVASEFLSSSIQSTNIVNPALVDPLMLWTASGALPATGEMCPALWWVVFAILLIDIAAVLGYLWYQRQLQWQRNYWRLAGVDNQRFADLLATLRTTNLPIVLRYELHEQPNTGGFYLALKPERLICAK